MPRKPDTHAPFLVFFGDEPFQKQQRMQQAIDALLPPPIARDLALSTYDGLATEDNGGPTLAGVLDGLQTLPFLSPRRVIAIRDADKFISAHRERLERYCEKPSPTGVLLLECRSFPKTTRLYKSIVAAGGEVVECKKLSGRALLDFALAEAQRLGKRFERGAAERLADLLGPDQGLCAMEIEKLAMFVGERPTITIADVSEMVGQSREEKIFAVMDAAAAGDSAGAVRLWRSTLATDPAAEYRAVGGIAFVLRKWLEAQDLHAQGQPIGAIAPKVMMWGKDQQLRTLLQRLPAPRMRALLAQLADSDAQSKSGTRTIENAVEALLIAAAG